VSNRDFFLLKTGDPVASQQFGLGQLSDLRQQQAMSLSYFDVFWLCAIVALVVLVLFMKRSVAEKGEHIGGG
jgi:DHA2 family multidrug resistance protein